MKDLSPLVRSSPRKINPAFSRLARARAACEAWPVSVLILVVEDSPEAAEADTYLSKPLVAEELALWVETLLRRARNEVGAGVLQAGDLRIDPRTRSVRTSGAQGATHVLTVRGVGYRLE